MNADSISETLVVVCGLPGVGKTTVAETISERVDGTLLRTDVVRKELLSDPDYTEAESRLVYDELFDRARAGLERGRSVVLDGTFQDEERRKRAGRLASTLSAEFRLVKVECSEGVVRNRIEHREGDASDADFEVHTLYRETFDPLSRDHVTVDNSNGFESTRRQVSAHF